MRIVRLYELWTVSVSVKTDCGELSATGCRVQCWDCCGRSRDGGDKYVMKSFVVVILTEYQFGNQSKMSEMGEARGTHLEMHGGFAQKF